MDRYSDMQQGGCSYGRANEIRERADRSDRRYDDFYADRSGRGGIRRSGDRDRQPRYNRHGGHGGGPHPGDKRRTDESRRNNSLPSKRRTTDSMTSSKSPRKEKEEISMEEDIPDSDVIVPDSLMDSVEKLRMRKEIKRNVLMKMLKSSFSFVLLVKDINVKLVELS